MVYLQRGDGLVAQLPTSDVQRGDGLVVWGLERHRLGSDAIDFVGQRVVPAMEAIEDVLLSQLSCLRHFMPEGALVAAVAGTLGLWN